ncbi:hypothetical protein BT63DRAFT_124344 [Microthyrium microscopicum]|uniref:EthD domain-containing protein n=1 Tax=Microthyrium microscopicum TaxID=703497 RepID=A0A6A6TU09_9PEZI|nr:hypothetical protein BT63DRAFT_124344 [Microthyrium microscopicum]
MPSSTDDSSAGIIWVASRTTQPSLKPEKFVDWYENIHVQEVIATGGVPGAVRYERVGSEPTGSQSGDEEKLGAYGWLTVYAFPQLGFRHTAQFKGLDGQKSPKGDLLDTIFKKAEFATRFAGLKGVWADGKWSDGGKIEGFRPAEWVVVATLVSDGDGGGKAIGAEEGKALEGLKGFVRAQVFDIAESSVLCEFERRKGLMGTMVMVGFEGEPDGEAVGKVVGRMGKVVERSVFKKRRGYDCWT